jgi:putative endonuclease
VSPILKKEYYNIMKAGTPQIFTGKYSAYYLLFYEAYQDINNAITREKEIKGWIRKKKWELIKHLHVT